MQEFTRGLAEIGAQVYGIGDTPRAGLPGHVARYLTDYLAVPRLMDEADVMARASQWLRGRHVDRVLANWEPLVLLAARMREQWGLPGMSVDTVRGFRDKQLMKERVAAAGLRVPQSFRAQSESQAREAAERVGYPLIVKPIAGAGSADTYRCNTEQEFETALRKNARLPMLSIEEFIQGEEFTYDTISIDGTPMIENVCQYLPTCLEARSEEWISPVVISVRDLSTPKMQSGIQLGRQVLRALGMGDGYTHMEWFYTTRGEAVMGEIACRPGGGRLVHQMNYTSDIDCFREWARVVCHGRFEAPTERKYNCGIIFKRAKGRGRITRIEGLGGWLRAAGPYALEDELLRPGVQRRNWKSTLLSDGWLMVRHPDWDETKRLSMLAASGVTMYAE